MGRKKKNRQKLDKTKLLLAIAIIKLLIAIVQLLHELTR